MEERKTGSARHTAVKLLGKTFSKKGYSNILLDKALSSAGMTAEDKAFCSALYYGVLERRITLDHIISCYVRQGTAKLNPDVLNILRLGVYQIKYMDSVPDSAAVNESVKLVKARRLGRLSGLVNAVLRSFIRDGSDIKLPDDPIKRMSVEYSCPEWLVKLLYENYDGELVRSFLEASLDKPPVTVRLNTVKCTDGAALGELMAEKTGIPCCFSTDIGDVTKTKAFADGLFHVQDVSSQLCCMALSPEKGDTVLDVCAAPGGKTFTLAEVSDDKARIYAFDIHESRVRLIQKGAERLSLSSVAAQVRDASKHYDDIPKADKILCDVPCSGLGVIRRKPEIKYKDPKEFERLPEIQYKILENCAGYLKPGGVLVYSTCTLSPNENGEVIDKFLNEHPEFEGESFLQQLGEPFGGYKATLFPKHFGGDGFFISKIKRKEK